MRDPQNGSHLRTLRMQGDWTRYAGSGSLLLLRQLRQTGNGRESSGSRVGFRCFVSDEVRSTGRRSGTKFPDEIRSRVVQANAASPELVRMNVEGTGHEFWADAA